MPEAIVLIAKWELAYILIDNTNCQAMQLIK